MSNVTDANIKQTERGFSLFEFQDEYGEQCSLQKSSAGNRECIWLGTSGRLCRQSGIVGVGMIDVPLNDEFLLISRMHLTRDMVQTLLPMLTAFVETGDIVPQPSAADTQSDDEEECPAKRKQRTDESVDKT